MYYFFVQGLAFLHTISRGYTFRTVEHLKSFKKKYTQVEMENGVKNSYTYIMYVGCKYRS